MITLLEKHPVFSWIITIFVAIVIFYMSTLTFGAEIPPTPFNIKSLIYHFSAFFFLSFFLLISLTKGKNMNLIYIGLIIAVIYGISDEIHQIIIPGRYFTLSDIMVDSLGILFAGIIYAISIPPTKTISLSKNKFKPQRSDGLNVMNNESMEDSIKKEFDK